MKRAYQERRLLRGVESMWASGERLLNRLSASPLNPFYHLGTLSIFLVLILTATGIYLTIFYRPGADRAYATVVGIDGLWFGAVIRATHRYAADALVVTVLLHALKMLLGDRFWGSRWLAWVSGWAMLALIWSIGVMGYWLIWDQRAQWLTEYGARLLGGQVALTFASAAALAGASTFFVIVLFMHVFLSVAIALGLLFHLMRLSRPRLWSPRWIMAEAAIALVVLALWRPATNAPPADPGRLVGAITIDGWYLGFLPLAERWGSGLFWGVAVILLVALAALPWLARGRSSGPAVVIEDACTGCGICVQECPYGALEMRALPPDARYPALAVVDPGLCTGCGVCVGACATDGIDLPGVPAAIVREHLKRAVTQARADQPPVVVFACQGHVALGTLPVRAVAGAVAAGEPSRQPAVDRAALTIPLVGGSAAAHTQVTPGFWEGGDAAAPLPIVTCALPCIGMVQPEMIRDSMRAGARAVVVVSGLDHDCGFREGPQWLAERLSRRQSLMREGVYLIAAATGDQAPLDTVLARLAHAQGLPAGAGQQGAPGARRAIAFAGGLATMILALWLTLAIELPVTVTPAGEAQLRVGISHAGQVKAAAGLSDDLRAKLPPGASAEQIVGGERFPVHIRVEVDGAVIAERVFEPGGLRREGTAYGLDAWPLAPGRHQIRLWMMDDGASWRETFAGQVDVEAGRVVTLIYDPVRAVFVAH